MMKIYWIKAQAPRRVLAFAKYLGLEFEAIEKDLNANEMSEDDYLALNPNGKAPTLVDGDTVLWEASAIMAHLAGKAGSDAWPSHNPSEQVQVLKWLSWTDTHWNSVVSPYYFQFVVKSTFGKGDPDREALRRCAEPFDKYAEILDAHLADRNWIALDRLSVADFQAASMAAYWKIAEMPMEPYGNIRAWLDRLMEIDAWRTPWPHGTDMAA